ncbi:MAG: hypothetical protein AAB570_04110 [Patescibacteria group bacterium]
MTIRGVKLTLNERIVHVERMALLPFLPRIGAGVSLLMLPFFVFFPLMAFGPIGVLILVVLAGCGAYMVVIVAVVWRGTVCVLTSERVIFVEQRGLLNRTVCDASVLTIQDVAYRSYGMFGKLFFIGMVRVVFRGVVPDMRFSPVAHPEHLTRLIHELRDVPKRTSGDGTFSRRHIDVT